MSRDQENGRRWGNVREQAPMGRTSLATSGDGEEGGRDVPKVFVFVRVWVGKTGDRTSSGRRRGSINCGRGSDGGMVEWGGVVGVVVTGAPMESAWDGGRGVTW